MYKIILTTAAVCTFAHFLTSEIQNLKNSYIELKSSQSASLDFQEKMILKIEKLDEKMDVFNFENFQVIKQRQKEKEDEKIDEEIEKIKDLYNLPSSDFSITDEQIEQEKGAINDILEENVVQYRLD